MKHIWNCRLAPEYIRILDGAHFTNSAWKIQNRVNRRERLPHLTNEVFDDPRIGDREMGKARKKWSPLPVIR
jgi:hypothetical protein